MRFFSSCHRCSNISSRRCDSHCSVKTHVSRKPKLRMDCSTDLVLWNRYVGKNHFFWVLVQASTVCGFPSGARFFLAMGCLPLSFELPASHEDLRKNMAFLSSFRKTGQTAQELPNSFSKGGLGGVGLSQVRRVTELCYSKRKEGAVPEQRPPWSCHLNNNLFWILLWEIQDPA